VKSSQLSTIVVVVMLAGGVARAADPRELEAKKACAAGHVDRGIELLAALFAETGHITYVYNQGRCYQQNGVADQAINRFREYLRRGTSISAADRREVEGFIEELEKQQQRKAEPAVAPPVEPPPAVAAPVTEPPPAVEQAAPPSRPDPALLRKIGLGAGAFGALAVATGVVLSFRVMSSERQVEKDLRSTGNVDNQALSKKLRDGARLETFQWVAYGIGAAAVAAGTVCYVLGLRAERESAVAFGVAPAPRGRGLATSLTVRY
jgi:hypothetical protein